MQRYEGISAIMQVLHKLMQMKMMHGANSIPF